MDKRVIFAVAGSGKTQHIINSLSLNKKALIVTYTDSNLKNLKNRIINKFGYFPENIRLYSYFSFLYTFCYRPFLGIKVKDKGINYKPPPEYTLHCKIDNMQRYLSGDKRLYSNRLAKLLEIENALGLINARIEKYFDELYIDEIQDFSGHDFNFLKSIAKSSTSVIFVGDFYQHTFDTSKDGIVNKSLHNDFNKYKKEFQKIGLIVDTDSLSKSYRCSQTVCNFISSSMGIMIQSHRNDSTGLYLVESKEEADRILNCNNTVKLFYQSHDKYNCYSSNWGKSKGEDHYSDVCVVLNQTTFKMFNNQKFDELNLNELKPSTRNKLYVACSRTKNNLYFVSDKFYTKKEKLNS